MSFAVPFPLDYHVRAVTGVSLSDALHVPPTTKPKILLVGPEAAGKTSILQVVFHNMFPLETLYLEPTEAIVGDDVSNSPFLQLEIWDIPGFALEDVASGRAKHSPPDWDALFDGALALIFVVDATSDNLESLTRLHQVAARAHRRNPTANFEVFVHKADVLSTDKKTKVLHAIHARVDAALEDVGLREFVRVGFHLTSVHDVSVFQAFSQVVQNLLPQRAALERILDDLKSKTDVNKSFLFDVGARINLASDSAPSDEHLFELCCTMIDGVEDVSAIYSVQEEGHVTSCELDSDTSSCALMRLDNSTVMSLRAVSERLALVCVWREDELDPSQAEAQDEVEVEVRESGCTDQDFISIRAEILDLANAVASANAEADADDNDKSVSASVIHKTFNRVRDIHRNRIQPI